MTSPMEQRNPYKGNPPRAWVRVHLVAAGGNSQTVELLADTGNPCAVIIGSGNLGLINLISGIGLTTNFGPMQGGWVQVLIPEIKFDQKVLAYASDAVVQSAQKSSPSFEGLAGLPLFRLMEYGGDADGFWIRPAPTTP